MKRTTAHVFLFIVMNAALLITACSDDTNSILQEKIEEYMGRMTARGFSGSVLVAKDGEIIHTQGYGLADKTNNIPITSNTVFTIGSITKQFTAAAILTLHSQGALNVNDPITRYFDNVPADKRTITLHHLLTHSAGFPGAIGDDFAENTREQFIEQALQTKLLFSPGERYEYSNVGYSLLGAIIEKVAKTSYEVYLREQLFLPAGMEKTGYVLPRWKDNEMAHGYRGQQDWGTLRHHPWAEDGPFWHLRANGGILSTVEDMYKWHLALSGSTILTPDAKKLLYSRHVKEGDMDSYYGYGWVIITTPRNTSLITHNGGNGIFSADFRRYVDDNVVIIVLANTAGQPAWRVSRVLARIVFGYEYELPSEKVEFLSIEDLPSTPAGKRALELFKIYEGGNEEEIRTFIADNCAPSFIESASMERLVEFIQTDQRGIGKARIAQVEKISKYSLKLTVQSKETGEWWLVSLKVEETEPQRISELGVVDTMPPSDMETSGLDRWRLPNSATGRRSSELLEALDRKDDAYTEAFVKNTFRPDLVEGKKLAQNIAYVKKIQSMVGEFELMGAMKTGQFNAKLKIKSLTNDQMYAISLTLDDAEPFYIIDIQIEDSE